MRYAARRDRNHSALARELEAHGVAVSDLSRVGGGCPDLVVSYGTKMLLIEVKAPGALRPAGAYRAEVRARQAVWAARHRGLVLTVTSASEVLAALGLDEAPTP